MSAKEARSIGYATVVARGSIVGWVEGPYRYGEHQAAYLGAGLVWLILAIVLALILAGQL